jgi:2-(1,2-epoxy-1,2-dihydrophenyl)acetyl-CoA isomerase
MIACPMSDTILLTIADGVAEITLNRPDKLNSFTRGMHEEMRAAMRSVRANDTVRAVILTGAGKGFCAGQDLAESMANNKGHIDPTQTLQDNYNPLIQSIHECGLPFICAVNGVAAGAGMSLAMACDIVLAAKSAKFIQAFVKIGLVPDAGGTYFLPRLVGSQRAMALAMTGEPLSAEKAEQWGLVWKTVEDADLMAEARKMAKHFAQAPTVALGLIKRAIYSSGINDLAEQLSQEVELQRQAALTHDCEEGIKAFVEKRAPKFTGR